MAVVCPAPWSSSMQWPYFVTLTFEGSVNGATQSLDCAPDVAFCRSKRVEAEGASAGELRRHGDAVELDRRTASPRSPPPAGERSPRGRRRAEGAARTQDDGTEREGHLKAPRRGQGHWAAGSPIPLSGDTQFPEVLMNITGKRRRGGVIGHPAPIGTSLGWSGPALAGDAHRAAADAPGRGSSRTQFLARSVAALPAVATTLLQAVPTPALASTFAVTRKTRVVPGLTLLRSQQAWPFWNVAPGARRRPSRRAACRRPSRPPPRPCR